MHVKIYNKVDLLSFLSKFIYVEKKMLIFPDIYIYIYFYMYMYLHPKELNVAIPSRL
jgi:hypothetical protein